MQSLTIIVSFAALFVSACSFLVAVLAYRRDRSKVRAWSRIYWHQQGPGVQYPVMYIRVVNKGRRAISILNLVKTARPHRWWEPLKQVEVPMGSDLREYMEEIHRKSVSHFAAIRLAEDESFEVVFKPKEFPDHFIFTHEDVVAIATRLFVEDVGGKCYSVRNARKHLKELAAGWEQLQELRHSEAAGKDTQPASSGL